MLGIITTDANAKAKFKYQLRKNIISGTKVADKINSDESFELIWSRVLSEFEYLSDPSRNIEGRITPEGSLTVNRYYNMIIVMAYLEFVGIGVPNFWEILMDTSEECWSAFENKYYAYYIMNHASLWGWENYGK